MDRWQLLHEYNIYYIIIILTKYFLQILANGQLFYNSDCLLTNYYTTTVTTVVSTIYNICFNHEIHYS